MKKARIFLSAILVVAILSGLTLPSLAVSKSTGITAINSTTETGSIPFEEIKNLFRKNNAETSEIASSAASEDESILNKICPAIEKLGLDVEIYSDFSDVTEESISNNKVSSLSSSSQSAQINRLLLDVTYYVYDSDDMEDALADPTVTIIDVMNNFTLDDSLEIPRDILIESGVEGAVTITSAALARHFYIDDQSSISVTFDNVILYGSDQSGGIDITDSYVTIDGANIQNCYADNNWGGGAILAYNQQLINNVMVSSGSLTVTNGIFMSNVATVSGGAIASFGPLSISDSTVDGNIAEESGGGVFIANFTASSITATLSNVTVDVNEATYYGGGICLLGITATVNNTSDITNNSALSGGGISSLASYTSISGSTIQGNMIASTDSDPDVSDFGGAGIYSAGRLSLSNTTVSYNLANFNTGGGCGILATNAGLVGFNYVGTENLTIVGGSLVDNLSYYEVNGTPYSNLFAGGAIAALELDVSVTGATISGNNATYGGAILAIGKTLDATDCTISTNAAETLGGGIFTSSFFEVLTELDDYDFSAPDINVYGGEISSNTSMVSGGGILMFGGDVTQNQDLTYTYESQLNVDDAAIIGTNSSCFGGGIYAESAEIAVDGASVITENSALGENISGLGMGSTWSGAGGGIVAAQSSLTLGACEINLNVAERDVAVTGSYSGGGGIMGGGRTFISVNDESALISENSSTYGGGICTDTLGTLDIVNGIISANIASNGAGVYSQNDLTMSGGVIGGNNAGSGLGGGIFSNNTVEITGGIIGEYAAESLIGNTATNGGGIYSTATGTVTISGGTVDGNTVTGSSSMGGGIYSANQVYINGGTISNNTAVAFGGGVYAKYVTIGVDNGEGVYTGTGVVSSNHVTSATSTKGQGGGIYISSGGGLTLNSGEISNNTASYDGAGVYLNGSSTSRLTMTMNSGTIINNTASRNGAGVFLNYSSFTLNSGAIYSNNASSKGGGVYVNNGNTMTMSGGQIYNNYATTDGGGVLLKTTPTSITFISPASLSNIHDNYKGNNISNDVSYLP